MAVVNGDFIAPTGELRADMFPGDTLATNITAWLTQAAVKAPDNDDAQTAWVYYRAWTDVANRLGTNPAEVDIEGEGGVRTLKEQIGFAQGRAAYWRSEYEAETSSVVSQRSFPLMRSLR
jgi:hypothetical protein